MQLSAIWVNGHYLFNTATFNFGAKFLYDFKLNGNMLTVERTENPNHITGFFSDTSPNLSLVSAIVGQNGSGKTSALTIIRNALHGNHAWGGYVLYNFALLIFENNADEEVHVVFSIPIYERLQKNSIQTQFIGFSAKREELNAETVYYSPFFEGKDFYFNNSNSPDIDISADRLLHLDIEENDRKEKHSPLLEHRYQNIYRQFDFLVTPLAKILYADYQIPFYDSVELYFRGPSFFPDASHFHNTSYDFRPFLTKLYELWQAQIYATERQVDSRTNIEEDKKIIKLWFLRELLRSLCLPLEAKNTFLDEGRVEIGIEDLDGLPLEEALIKFLENHNFSKFKSVSLPTATIKKLVAVSFEVIDSLPKARLLDTEKIELDFENARKIMDAHKDFLYEMRRFTDNPVGFIDVSPGNHIDLSSGEKAVLDLLSRFSFCIEEIKRRKEQSEVKGYEEGFPQHFILLLDEGDMGFHPVWKKKFVKTIVDVLPKFFEMFEGATVQIIFNTHDPLTLSDIPNRNVVYLKKDGDSQKVLAYEDSTRPKRSFGANISTLLSDSFFVEDGLVGDFAIHKIDKTIQWLQNKDDSSDADYHRKVIETIDEPLIQKKLSEMFAEKTGQNDLELKVVEAQIRMLEERKKELQKKP